MIVSPLKIKLIDNSYENKYKLKSFDTLTEPNIPASVKQYRKLIKKFSDNKDSDINKRLSTNMPKISIINFVTVNSLNAEQ
jgi:hypothetical protein